MIEILNSIIFLGIFLYVIYFFIKKRIDNKKETGRYFSFSFKKNPFLYVGLLFFILTIISYLIAGEDTMFSTISFFITYLIFLIWLFIYLPIKFFSKSKNKKKKKDENLRKSKKFVGLLFWLLFIIFIVLGVKFMGEHYDRLEKSLNKERFDKMMVFFNSNDEYQDLSITQKKTITVKLFLLARCRGGEETLNNLIQFEHNILYDACRIVQNNNILSKFSSNNNDLISFHMKALNTDFKGAVKLYDWFINE